MFFHVFNFYINTYITALLYMSPVPSLPRHLFVMLPHSFCTYGVDSPKSPFSHSIKTCMSSPAYSHSCSPRICLPFSCWYAHNSLVHSLLVYTFTLSVFNPSTAVIGLFTLFHPMRVFGIMKTKYEHLNLSLSSS